jgi:hypothetical protein
MENNENRQKIEGFACAGCYVENCKGKENCYIYEAVEKMANWKDGRWRLAVAGIESAMRLRLAMENLDDFICKIWKMSHEMEALAKRETK